MIIEVSKVTQMAFNLHQRLSAHPSLHFAKQSSAESFHSLEPVSDILLDVRSSADKQINPFLKQIFLKNFLVSGISKLKKVFESHFV